MCLTALHWFVIAIHLSDLKASTMTVTRLLHRASVPTAVGAGCLPLETRRVLQPRHGEHALNCFLLCACRGRALPAKDQSWHVRILWVKLKWKAASILCLSERNKMVLKAVYLLIGISLLDGFWLFWRKVLIFTLESSLKFDVTSCFFSSPELSDSSVVKLFFWD